MKYFLPVFFACFFVFGVGCEKIDETKRPKTATEELKNKAEEVSIGMSDKARHERDEFVRVTQEEMNVLNVQIEKFARKVEKETGDIKEKMRKKLSSLERTRSEVRQGIAKIKAETREKWYEMKVDIADAVDDLKQSIANVNSNED